jgi:hypothetical protein
MNGKLPTGSPALMREITRYLAVVDAFREELCEPTWLREPTPAGVTVAGSSTDRKSSRIRPA